MGGHCPLCYSSELLFTFLGTITCAVLAGMMMGAFKGAKWFSVSVSLVFPGVIFGMARGRRVELMPQQIVLLAAFASASFWVTYLVSAFVFFCEQKAESRPSSPAPAPQAGDGGRKGGSVAATGARWVPSRPWATEPARELCLEQLQGDWVCEASGASELQCKKSYPDQRGQTGVEGN